MIWRYISDTPTAGHEQNKNLTRSSVVQLLNLIPVVYQESLTNPN